MDITDNTICLKNGVRIIIKAHTIESNQRFPTFTNQAGMMVTIRVVANV